jgi:hypothetical protein
VLFWSTLHAVLVNPIHADDWGRAGQRVQLDQQRAVRDGRLCNAERAATDGDAPYGTGRPTDHTVRASCVCAFECV